MTPIEYGLAGIGATAWILLMSWACGFLWSHGKENGQFMAIDRINSVLDKREDGEDSPENFKFPKRTE